MKKLYILSLFLLVVMMNFITSCRRSSNSKYFYDANKDTIAPVIKISVPQAGGIFAYGQHVHIVGTVTDYQSIGKTGKLMNMKIEVMEMAKADTSYISTHLLKTPDIDSKEGYTFNEKMLILFGPTSGFFKLRINATDYALRTATDSLYFYMN